MPVSSRTRETLMNHMLMPSSDPRQGLSCPEVPQQLRHVGGSPLPPQGELLLLFARSTLTDPPQLYYTSNGPRPDLSGQEELFPEPDNQSKMKRSCENAEHVGE